MSTTTTRELACSKAQYLKLKVNVRSIVAEQRIIRSCEEKLKAKAKKAGQSVYVPWDLLDKDREKYLQMLADFGLPYGQLREHRTGRLRRIARLTHLTLAAAKGRKYKECESSTKDPVSATALQAKWDKFRVSGSAEEWLNATS